MVTLFRKFVGKAISSDHFSKIVIRYKQKGYNIDVIKQSACLLVNLVMVDYFACLFNCTPVGQDSDNMMAPT